MNKNKVLFVSGYLPSLSYPSSGQKIAFRNLKDMAEDCELVLIAFCNGIEKEYLSQTRRELSQIGIDYHIFEVNNFHKAVSVFLSGLRPFLTFARARKARATFERYVSWADLVHFEFTQSLGLLDRAISENKKVSVRFHDCYFKAFSRRAALTSNFLVSNFWRWESMKLKSLEVRAACQATKAIVLNEGDAELLRLEGASVDVEYPRVSDEFMAVDRASVEPDSLMFWGQMAREENEDAVLFFVNEIFPAIINERPSVKLYVVGASPTTKVVSLACDNVKVTGFVDSPKAYFERCAVAVVPLRFGSGIKIKAVETLAAGVPTVATTVGAEGVRREENLYVEDDVQGFSRQVLDLLEVDY
ncbi:MAG: glycosyltransferase [Cellvibrionaceae bacterium]